MGESTSAFTRLPAGGSWVVTEKVHGANFSVLAASVGSVHFAKRSGLLPAGEDFYSFRSRGLDARLAACSARLLEGARRAHADVRSACIYGELFGGAYPHSEVTVVQGLLPVQRGVWYSPDVAFMGFDVCLDAGGTRHFLDFDDARALAKAAGFAFAEPLARGSLSECNAFSERFDSTIPARLGLPPLAGPNLAEGIVVRAAREPEAAEPEPERGAEGRLMFKKKIAEFGEKQYAHNGWKEAKSAPSSSLAASSREQRDAEALLRYEMLAAINEQRLDAVISKGGRTDARDKEARRALLRDFKEDVRAALVDDGLLPAAAPLPAELEAECDEASRDVVGRRLREQLRETAAADR